MTRVLLSNGPGESPWRSLSVRGPFCLTATRHLSGRQLLGRCALDETEMRERDRYPTIISHGSIITDDAARVLGRVAHDLAA
jgi:hypothetical protein